MYRRGEVLAWMALVLACWAVFAGIFVTTMAHAANPAVSYHATEESIGENVATPALLGTADQVEVTLANEGPIEVYATTAIKTPGAGESQVALYLDSTAVKNEKGSLVEGVESSGSYHSLAFGSARAAGTETASNFYDVGATPAEAPTYMGVPVTVWAAAGAHKVSLRFKHNATGESKAKWRRLAAFAVEGGTVE